MSSMKPLDDSVQNLAIANKALHKLLEEPARRLLDVADYEFFGNDICNWLDTGVFSNHLSVEKLEEISKSFASVAEARRLTK